MKSRLHAAIFTAVFLAGCASSSMLTKPGEPLLQPNTGLVVASLGYKISKTSLLGKDNPYIALKIRDESALTELGDSFIDTKGSKILGLGTMIGGWDELENIITTTDNKRMLVVYVFKPGSYSIPQRSSSFPFHQLTLNDKNPLKFQVKAGEIVYLGSHELNFSTHKDFLGTTRPSTGSIAVKDNLVDDIGFLNALRPETLPMPVVNALAPVQKP